MEIKTRQQYGGELSLKDLINKSAELIGELYAKKRFILAIGLIFMFFFGLRAYLDKTIYTADLTFMIDEDSGNPLGSLSGVLVTFGISQMG